MTGSRTEDSPAESGFAYLRLLGRLALSRSPAGKVLLSGLPAALIAYLHLEGRPVSRESVADLFWPRKDRAQRLHGLRQALVKVRRAVPGLLVESDGKLGIRPGGLSSDLIEVEAALSSGDVPRILPLWEGTFMEGFRRPESWDLEDWMDRRRSAFEHRVLVSVLEWAGSPDRAGDRARVLSVCRRAVALLPDEQALTDLCLHLEDEERRDRMSQASDPDVVRAASAVREGRRAGLGIRRGLPRITAVAGVLLVMAAGWRVLDSRSETVSSADLPGSLLYCSAQSSRGSGPPELYRMQLDGSGKHRISTIPGLCESAWLPEHGVLVSLSVDAQGKGNFFQLGPHPSNPIAEWEARPLRSVRPGWQTIYDPYRPVGNVWQGRWVFFSAADSTGNHDIWALDGVADSVIRLTSEPSIDTDPRFDPVRETVVFHSDRSGDGDLYEILLTAPGRPARRITTDPVHEQMGIPWGDLLLFSRGRGEGVDDGNREVVLLDRSTGTEELLTGNGWNDLLGAWSPDGLRICWTDERAGHYQSVVRIMDLHTRRIRTLDGGPGRTFECSFTPDGRGVLARHEGSFPSRILLLRGDRSEPEDLSQSPYPSFAAGVFPIPPLPRGSEDAPPP